MFEAAFNSTTTDIIDIIYDLNSCDIKAYQVVNNNTCPLGGDSAGGHSNNISSQVTFSCLRLEIRDIDSHFFINQQHNITFHI